MKENEMPRNYIQAVSAPCSRPQGKKRAAGVCSNNLPHALATLYTEGFKHRFLRPTLSHLYGSYMKPSSKKRPLHDTTCRAHPLAASRRGWAVCLEMVASKCPITISQSEHV